MRNNSKGNTFDCPQCGNPLYKSKRDIVKCVWCNTLIVPQGFGKNSKEAKILERTDLDNEKKREA